MRTGSQKVRHSDNHWSLCACVDGRDVRLVIQISIHHFGGPVLRLKCLSLLVGSVPAFGAARRTMPNQCHSDLLWIKLVGSEYIFNALPDDLPQIGMFADGACVVDGTASAMRNFTSQAHFSRDDLL